MQDISLQVSNRISPSGCDSTWIFVPSMALIHTTPRVCPISSKSFNQRIKGISNNSKPTKRFIVSWSFPLLRVQTQRRIRIVIFLEGRSPKRKAHPITPLLSKLLTKGRMQALHTSPGLRHLQLRTRGRLPFSLWPMQSGSGILKEDAEIVYRRKSAGALVIRCICIAITFLLNFCLMYKKIRFLS